MPPLRTPPRAAPRPPARPPARPVRSARRPVDRTQRQVAMLLGGLFIVSFGAILFVLYQIFLGGTREQPITATKPAFTIPANARRFTSLSDLEKAGRLDTPFALTLTDSEVNQRLKAELSKQTNLPFKDVTAAILDGRVEFSGSVRAAGLDLPATASLRFFAQAGKLAYDITSISFGPLPVPGPARQIVTDSIDRQLTTQKLTDQWTLDDVQMRLGVMTVVGRPR